MGVTMLREGLADSGLSAPSVAAQPKDPPVSEIAFPPDDRLQDTFASALQAALTVSGPETRILGTRKFV